MENKDLKAAYKTIMDDHFPAKMEISFIDSTDSRQTLCYEKASWLIDDVEKGLRYGENPGQEAALYRLINGNLWHQMLNCCNQANIPAKPISLMLTTDSTFCAI